MLTVHTPPLHRSSLFAALDDDLHLERIAGGNESEVYCTDDRRYVVKVKGEDGGSLADVVELARTMRNAADAFAADIGPEHRIPNYFLVARNERGEAHPVVIQPYYRDAQPLFVIDYAALSRAERQQIARQLLRIIRRSWAAYWRRGRMPDLYGRTSTSHAERIRANRWYKFPHRLWSFIIKRNLLRSHNLMLLHDPAPRLILVDYDPVRRSQLYQFVYYKVRLLLFLRDLILIGVMWLCGRVPRA
jgi:hypothetical protein